MPKTITEKRIEIAQTILLSSVVLISAWCGYQAGRWGGIQTLKLAESNSVSVMAAKQVLIAESRRGIDTFLAFNFVNAVIERNRRVVDFYISHLDTEFGQLLKAWLNTNPLRNAKAPPHPLAMPEYTESISVAYDREVEVLWAREKLLFKEAQEAKSVSDRLTYRTVLLSSVLFLGGIVSKLESIKLRIILLIFAYLTAIWTTAQVLSITMEGI